MGATYRKKYWMMFPERACRRVHLRQRRRISALLYGMYHWQKPVRLSKAAGGGCWMVGFPAAADRCRAGLAPRLANRRAIDSRPQRREVKTRLWGTDR